LSEEQKPANSDFANTLVSGRTTERFTRLGLLAYLESGDLDGVVMFDRDDLPRMA
jgi:hypothetical protein